MTTGEGGGRSGGTLRRNVLPDRRVEGFSYPTIIRNFSTGMKVEIGFYQLEPKKGGRQNVRSLALTIFPEDDFGGAM